MFNLNKKNKYENIQVNHLKYLDLVKKKNKISP